MNTENDFRQFYIYRLMWKIRKLGRVHNKFVIITDGFQLLVVHCV